MYLIHNKFDLPYLFFFSTGTYTRESKELFDFISKLIVQAKRKCKFIAFLFPCGDYQACAVRFVKIT